MAEFFRRADWFSSDQQSLERFYHVGGGFNDQSLAVKLADVARAKIEIPEKRIAEFCRANHIRKLALFGSVLREDFSDQSDIDVLVEFHDGFTPGLDFFAFEDELSEILGRRVDLNTKYFLSKYFRDSALADAEVYFVEA